MQLPLMPGEGGAIDLWDVALPSEPGRTHGVTMAGFEARHRHQVDLGTVPHPALTLAIDLGGDSFTVEDARGGQQRGSVVAGLAPTIRARGDRIRCLQVRLSPVTALGVLRTPPGELNRAVVSLEDLWGSDSPRVVDRLGEARNWSERFALMDDLLAHRQSEGPTPDPEVAWAWNRMVGGRGRVRVEALAGELGWSRKRLWSRFRAQIGMTPKGAARLVRFDHAAHRLAAGEDPADTALACGYADQSHLHREVRGFTGSTPATVAAAPWLAVDDVAWPGSGTGNISSRRR